MNFKKMYLYDFLVFGVILLKYLDKFFVCLFMLYYVILDYLSNN